MEDYERFKLSKSNVIMIFITLFIVFILSLVSFLLYQSLQKPNKGLPQLNVTQGRSTTESTTPSTRPSTTTTSRVIRTSSPYYDLKVDELLNDSLYTQYDLKKDQALEVGKAMVDLFHALYDISDYSVFDTEGVILGAKDGETDKIVRNNISYGELYNFDEFSKKFISNQSRRDLLTFTINEDPVFLFENDKYYRMTDNTLVNMIEFVDVSLVSATQTVITLNVRYYNKNYKDLGYTSPNYKTTTFTLTYDSRWKVKSYRYPLYD